MIGNVEREKIRKELEIVKERIWIGLGNEFYEKNFLEKDRKLRKELEIKMK